MSLQPITSQIYTLEGVPQTTLAPGISALRAPKGSAGSREKDILLLHISVTGQLEATTDLLQTLVQSFAERFFEQSGSLTAALRQCVDLVNGELRRHNRSADVKRQGALTAAVLRGDELFMVQVGEVQAYLGHSFGLEPIPMEPASEITPLGFSTTLTPRFFHNWLQEGNLLLLADPRIAHWPKERFVNALVDSDLLEAERKLAEMLARSTARLLLVMFHEGKAQLIGGQNVTRASLIPSLGVVSEPASNFELVNEIEATAIQELELIPNEADEAALIRQRRRARVRATQPTVQEPEPRLMPTNIRANPVGRSQADFREQAPPDKRQHNPQLQTRKVVASGLRGMSNGLRGLATMLNMLRVPEQEQSDAPPRERFYATLIAIFIPLLVAIVLISGLLQGDQRARISVLRGEINTALSAAQASEQTNPEEARQLYQSVLALSAEAKELVPDDTIVDNQRQVARDALDKLDGVMRLSAETLYTYPEGTELTAIALGVDKDDQHYIYTLDSANNIVYQHLTDSEYNLIEESPRAILRIGEGIGTHIVGSIIDIVWKSANSNTDDALTMVDSKGAAISFYPTRQDKLAVSLPLSAEWGNPIALLTYLGRIYVLDQGQQASQGQMWRYLPNGHDFVINNDSRSLVLPEMDKAVDATISIDDSSVLLLYEDGRLHRYRDGRLLWDETALQKQGFTRPLVAPNSVKIGGIGVRASVFVLDAGSERIVEFSFAGVPLREVRVGTAGNSAEFLTNATDLAIMQNPLRLYIVADNQLVVAAR